MSAQVRIKPESLRRSRQALHDYQRATNKDASEVLNRFARNVLMRAIQFTKKTTKTRIRKESDPKKTKLLYKLAANDGFKKGGGIQAEVDKRFQRRLQSRGYIAAGWLKALQVFGGRSRRVELQPGGMAAAGGGSKARTSRLLARFWNAAIGAGEVGYEALNKAWLYVTNDMQTYALRKMQRTARKHSAR